MVARKRVSSFPINISPLCLQDNGAVTSDYDAIYISSKDEIIEWSVRRGYEAKCPLGTRGIYKDTALIEITKR